MASDWLNRNCAYKVNLKNTVAGKGEVCPKVENQSHILTLLSRSKRKYLQINNIIKSWNEKIKIFNFTETWANTRKRTCRFQVEPQIEKIFVKRENLND